MSDGRSGLRLRGIHNWSTREVSAIQALAAEQLWGFPAAWVLFNIRPPGWPPRGVTPTAQPIGLDPALEVIGIALAAVAPQRREALALNLAGWAREGGADHYRVAIAHLLLTANEKPSARPGR